MKNNSNLAFSIENNYNNPAETKNCILPVHFGTKKKQHLQIIKENILAASMDVDDIKAPLNFIK